MMDNKVFNVNGLSRIQLEKTLELALTNKNGDVKPPVGWIFDLNKGIILTWHDKDVNKFMHPPTVSTLTDILYGWLKSDEAMSMEFKGWDTNGDHDGSNDLGWRVYCEDWGHVGNNNYAIVAVRPSYCWYGK